jgi:hypothetical protein
VEKQNVLPRQRPSYLSRAHYYQLIYCFRAGNFDPVWMASYLTGSTSASDQVLISANEKFHEESTFVLRFNEFVLINQVSFIGLYLSSD